MMKAHVLTGSKAEIVEMVTQLPGAIREVIVFTDESSAPGPESSAEDMFAEMEPFTATAGGADYSRQALYTRLDDE